MADINAKPPQLVQGGNTPAIVEQPNIKIDLDQNQQNLSTVQNPPEQGHDINAKPPQLVQRGNTSAVIEQPNIKIDLDQNQQNLSPAQNPPEQGQDINAKPPQLVQGGNTPAIIDQPNIMIDLDQNQQNLPAAQNPPEQGQCEVVMPDADINNPKGCCEQAMDCVRKNWLQLVCAAIGAGRWILSCVTCCLEHGEELGVDLA